MDVRDTIFLAGLILASLTSGSLAVYGWCQRGVRSARAFGAMMSAAFVWCFCACMMTLAADLPDKSFWCAWQYLGISAVAPLLFVFTAIYAQRSRWLTLSRLTLVVVPALIAMAAALTNDRHGLMWSVPSGVDVGRGHPLPVLMGPANWVHTCYAYGLAVLSSYALVQAARMRVGLYRRQAFWLLVGVVLLVATDATSMIVSERTGGLDLTPLMFVGVGVLMAFAIFREELLDVAPVAREAVFASMSSGALILDGQGRVRDFNPAAAHLLNLDARMIGRPAAEALAAMADVLRVEESTGGARKEVRIVTARSERWLDVCATPWSEKRGRNQGRLLIVEDITERKRAEADKARLSADLAQSQRVESVGRLAGGMAHDFNNVLQTILGFSALLKGELPADDARRSDIEEIEKAAQRAATLTSQLLAFSSRQMLRPQPLDANVQVRQLERMNRRLLGEDLRCTVDLAERLPLIRADANQLYQVLLNLCLNARDAMRTGGQLTLATRLVDISPADLANWPDAKPGRHICISVADTGVGMSPEVMRHLFEPFFTTKPHGLGVGMGLATAYGIVRQHNGFFRVSSKVGEGSTFEVFFPALAEAAGVEAVGEEPSADPRVAERGHGQRILLVEDDDSVRRLAVDVLTRTGYQVFEAADALAALHIFEQEKGRFDLVFSDLVLPDRSGVDLVRELIARAPRMRVLLTSGYSDERTGWSARDVPWPLLRKPYPLGDLLARVQRVLQGIEAADRPTGIPHAV